MKNPLPWLLSVVILLAWSAYELYPPTTRPLLSQFEREAENTQDPVFKDPSSPRPGSWTPWEQPVRFSQPADRGGHQQPGAFLPQGGSVPAGKDTNRIILNRLQRDALGQIKLGLDLQGGMSFVVQMQTNELKDPRTLNAPWTRRWKSCAAASTSYGVAEPTIQRQGADRIEIQMPGLTESEKDAVKRQIERAAFLGVPHGAPGERPAAVRGVWSPRLRGADRGPPGSEVGDRAVDSRCW
jgi:hypothetical protein